MLKVKKLNSGYQDIQILWDVSLNVKKGEAVALIGSNGAGKSTLLESIIGLLKPMSGEIEFAGEIIFSKDVNLSTRSRVKRGMALVPQGRRLFPDMSVEENILMGGFLLNDKEKINSNLEKMYGLFPRLYERKNQPAGKLSGGEQQMVAIARALMMNPKFLMIDEFSLGLAPVIVDSLIEIVQEIKKTDTSLLIVEQDVVVALSIADRAYVLETGRIVMEGRAAELMDDDRIKEAYLGI